MVCIIKNGWDYKLRGLCSEPRDPVSRRHIYDLTPQYSITLNSKSYIEHGVPQQTAKIKHGMFEGRNNIIVTTFVSLKFNCSTVETLINMIA